MEFADILRDSKTESLLVTNFSNIRYLTGFKGTNAALLITKRRGWFITDPRYRIQAERGITGFSVRIASDPVGVAASIARKAAVRTLGFEGALGYSLFARLRGLLPGVRLKTSTAAIEKERAVKKPFEIERIKKAIGIAERALGRIEKKGLRGRRENEVSFDLEVSVRKQGAEGVAFEVIVASGARSAMPHGVASEKRITGGELVIVDVGVDFGGYKSDLTRTYCAGSVKAGYEKIYAVVRQAHDKAIEALKDGVSARKIDGAARDVIKKAGYGKFFVHGTGHGVGLEVHERPYINPRSSDIMEEGMVVAIEPAVYIEGVGGVRIEDMAVVERGGCRLLSNAPTELLSL